MECDFSILGETGQRQIKYKFINDSVIVKDKNFKYKSNISSAQVGLKLENEYNYVLSSVGNLLNGKEKLGIEIYKDFKKVVPFELKK